jgi:hypothetical protein
MQVGVRSGKTAYRAVRAVTQAVAVKFMVEKKTATPMAVRKVEEEMPRLWAVQCLKLQYRCHRAGWRSNSPEIAQKP